MTKDEVRRLVQEYQTKELDEWEDEHIAGGFREDSDTFSLVLTDRLEDIRTQLANADYRKVRPTAEALLKDHRLTLATESHEFQRLCHGLLIAQDHVLRVELERLDGRWYRGRSLENSRATAGALRVPVEKEPVSIMVGEAVKLYFQHYDHRDARTNE
ncbi:MAG: hypothetical protein WAU05_09945, partial [Nitrospira sp.]